MNTASERTHRSALHQAPRPFPRTIRPSDDHFGEHLTLDGYLGSEKRLGDRDHVLRVLCELPLLLGMRILAAPVVHAAPGNGLKDPGGWTGFVVIEESHISIHTFPKSRFVSIDVYTCRNGLSMRHLADYLREQFELAQIELNFLRRGLQFAALAPNRAPAIDGIH